MAKKSKIARNEQRKLVVERYAEKRLALKKALVDPNSTGYGSPRRVAGHYQVKLVVSSHSNTP